MTGFVIGLFVGLACGLAVAVVVALTDAPNWLTVDRWWLENPERWADLREMELARAGEAGSR